MAHTLRCTVELYRSGEILRVPYDLSDRLERSIWTVLELYVDHVERRAILAAEEFDHPDVWAAPLRRPSRLRCILGPCRLAAGVGTRRVSQRPQGSTLRYWSEGRFRDVRSGKERARDHLHVGGGRRLHDSSRLLGSGW